MFIAMNRFLVVKGSEEAFERMWQGRDSYLDEMAGFVEFHLLKGPEAEDHTLYSSHTVWASKADFEAWQKGILDLRKPAAPVAQVPSGFDKLAQSSAK